MLRRRDPLTGAAAPSRAPLLLLLGLACGCTRVDDEAVAQTHAPLQVTGVHGPAPIDPDVDVLDGQWLRDLYLVLLDRPHDPAGYRANLRALEDGASRDAIVHAFVGSTEFTLHPELRDRAGFVRRLFTRLLGRGPSADEIAFHTAHLRDADGAGDGLSWRQLIDGFYAAPEYKQTRCQTGHFTLGAPVRPGALLLNDLFEGHARLQTIDESEEVTLNVPSAQNLWDQKLPIIRDPDANRYLAFTRAFANDTFTISLLTSDDAIHFDEVAPLFERIGPQTFYDPQIAVDDSVCPPRYVMVMECLGSEGASLCASQSTTPGLPETWSRPKLLVDGCAGRVDGVCRSPAAQSASTGTALIDGKNRYIGWTQVYDGVGPNDPQVHTYSQFAKVSSFDTYFGNVMQGTSAVGTMMSATFPSFCTSAWDCNNRDAQDWKREGDWYYAIYNGANHFRCEGSWGVGVARSQTPIGAEYTDRLPLERGIRPERHDICGISYPVVNVIDGELFVYYAYYPLAGGNRTMRARLVPTP